MDIEDRLDILADAAKYDVSCSSSGSSRPNRPGGLGNAHYSGICHSWTAGRALHFTAEDPDDEFLHL